MKLLFALFFVKKKKTAHTLFPLTRSILTRLPLPYPNNNNNSNSNSNSNSSQTNKHPLPAGWKMGKAIVHV